MKPNLTISDMFFPLLSPQEKNQTEDNKTGAVSENPFFWKISIIM